jgi:hypothetical protein
MVGAMTGSGPPPALLERAEELAAVDAAIAAAAGDSGRVVVVEGPPRIGKTSVLTEGRARAAASGLRVLQARGSELETAYSFGVVRQLLEAVVALAARTSVRGCSRALPRTRHVSSSPAAGPSQGRRVRTPRSPC